VVFLERNAAVNTLAPFRNVGLMAYDWNADETRTWALGVFAENPNEFGEGYQDRSGVALTGRTTWLPWYEGDPSGPRFVQIGASYSYRKLGVTERKFAQTPETIIKEGMSHTPNFIDTGTIAVDDYHLAGVEAATVLGPFSLQGEYIALAGSQNDVDESLFLQGGYIEATYWLTGEHRNFLRKYGIFGPVTPRSPFTGRGVNGGREFGCGAWEAGARLSWIDLNHANIDGGEMTNISLGLNWYYAVRSRVMLDYIHSFLNRSGLDSNADIVAMRFAYAF
jgi:phosphate-selective porin OprO/OprP